jgi:DNA-binding CsgD family transcriptional regulator
VINQSLLHDFSEEISEHLQFNVRSSDFLSNISQLKKFVFWKDKKGIYLGCNQAFAAIAGYRSPSEFIGKTDYDMNWSEETARIFREGDRAVFKAQSQLSNLKEPVSVRDNDVQTVIGTKLLLTGKDSHAHGILGLYDFEDSEKKKRFFLDLLTPREKQCLYYLLQGKTALEISRIVSLSHRTVEDHIASTREKTGTSTRSALIEKAFEIGLIKLEF